MTWITCLVHAKPLKFQGAMWLAMFGLKWKEEADQSCAINVNDW